MQRFRDGGDYQNDEARRLEELRSVISQAIRWPHGITLESIEHLEKEYAALFARNRWLEGLADVEKELRMLRQVKELGVQKELFAGAFHKFVGLVQPIPQVRRAVGFDGQSPDVFTYIEQRDMDVCRAVFSAEYQIMEEFPRPSIDFHITYLQGRPLTVFVNPLPELVFSR